jgi:hypothetical protein
MPHLFKIGRTLNEHQRLREANSHDTFKPPSGFEFGMVLRVLDMCAVETALHARFADKRRLNVHGNRTEFFAVPEADVIAAFSDIDGERVDLATLNPTAETKDAACTRKLLHEAVAAAHRCSYRLDNPKHPGTKCHARYEIYKGATTLDESLALGTFEDIVYDYTAGFLTLLPPPSEWL